MSVHDRPPSILAQTNRVMPTIIVTLFLPLSLACNVGERSIGVERSRTETNDIEAAAEQSVTTSSKPSRRLQTTLATTRFFVAPTGSDADAGTELLPWRTLTQSLPKLRAGDTLFVRGGTYTENVKNPILQPATASAPITVVAYPGERPIIVGLLWLTRPNYWTLDGINVTWSDANPSTSHMVKITNGIGWAYQNSELWGARSFAALLVAGTTSGEPAEWVLRGNCVHDTYASNRTNQDHNLYINTGTSAGSGLIERNVLFNAPNGQNVKLGYGRSIPQPGDGTANVTVRFNTMYGALKSLLVSDESTGNTIERNILVRSLDGYAVRAYRLTGTDNVFRDNVGFGFSKLQYADAGYREVTDGGGNYLPLDPKFDALGCGAFRPTQAAAKAYGRYAP